LGADVSALALLAAACVPGTAALEAPAPRDGVTRTSVVACVDGRREAVRRAVLRAGRGAVVRDVAAAGSRVAWTEARRRGGGWTTVVLVADAASGTVVRSRASPGTRGLARPAPRSR
jgi:hypothetical protein